MIDKGVLTYDYYIEALTRIIAYIKSRGKFVYILSHEIATSWSHKYAELFADYKQHDCVLDLKDMERTLERIASYINAETNASIRSHLCEQLPALKAKSREMWDEVW